MEEIKDIVQTIVRGCQQGGLTVPEILAAFVARTVVEEDATTFALDRPISPEQKQEVVLRSIEKLLERDNPALEMIKMQVDFDATYLSEESEAQRRLKARNKMVAGHKIGISEVAMNDAQDYESLTALYRKIFRFLLEFAPNSKLKDKAVEREVAAALESVFPRVGLKAFIQLPNEDKMTQVMELARIVLGIRLFNKEEGRGTGGIDDMDKDSALLSTVLLDDIEKDIAIFSDACNKYQRAIVRANLYQRRKQHLARELQSAQDDDSVDSKPHTRGKSQTPAQTQGKNKTSKHPPVRPDELFLVSQLEDVNDHVLQRWGQELANRRQYLNFLRTLQDEVKFLKEKIATLVEKYKAEMVSVKSMVSNKTSVPKEMVYPRFDALGLAWLQLYEEVVILVARSNTFQCLCKYRLSFSPTLADELHGDEQDNGIGNREEELLFAADAKPSNDEFFGALADEKGAMRALLSAKEAANEDAAARVQELNEYNNSNNNKPLRPSVSLSTEGLERVAASGAELLTIESTPDFALLPLEMQGFCPWTIVEANGLLVPGRPALGIVRFENLFYVCDHALAVQQFMERPEHYLQQIRLRALRSPEYIHLLRLQRWFPNVSVAKLLQRAELEVNNITGQPLTKDAATETPTHFVESYIDLNYHWNEWELRRRALKLVNLKNCRTTGQQTDKSHFRREAETQVYEPREQETQTKRESGTNPPRVTTYIQGLRGKVVAQDAPTAEAKAEAKDTEKEDKKAADKEFKPRSVGYPKVGVVTLTLDL